MIVQFRYQLDYFVSQPDRIRFVDCQAGFNAVLLNRYGDGSCAIQWHADQDEGLGEDPVIGSLNLGAVRNFCLKSKRADEASGKLVFVNVPCFHGALLVMARGCQKHYLHAVPTQEKCMESRINLTFRCYARQNTSKPRKEQGAPRTAEVELRSGQPVADAAPGQHGSWTDLRTDELAFYLIEISLSPPRPSPSANPRDCFLYA